jgi:hypothetical protein
MLTHVVVFWTDKPHGEARDKLLAATRELLTQIPGPVEFRSGMAVPSPRGVVDDSFAVALAITFPDRDTMMAFRRHPLHTKFVEEYVMKLSARRVAYDFG